MRLLCDEMLAGLCRWLRAAGHDTALAATATPDKLLLGLAETENRLLLTRDGGLSGERMLRLGGQGFDAQAAELRERTGLNWLHAPFTRCLRDNSLLMQATPDQRTSAPPSALLLPGPFRACPTCGRLYWPGSHVRRMETRLRRWQDAPTGG